MDWILNFNHQVYHGGALLTTQVDLTTGEAQETSSVRKPPFCFDSSEV